MYVEMSDRNREIRNTPKVAVMKSLTILERYKLLKYLKLIS